MDTKVYIFQDIDLFSDADLERAYSLVSEQRRKKAQEYVRPIDRKLSVIAALLLRHALRQGQWSGDNLPEFSLGYHGKPYFLGNHGNFQFPYFNISHCSEAVACAVSDREIGVDVEPYSSYDPEVARVVFNPQEQLVALESKENFAQLWTIKESYLKLTGEGLCDDLPGLMADVGDVKFATYHSQGKGLKGYACTVCAHTLPSSLITFNPIIVDKTTLING